EAVGELTGIAGSPRLQAWGTCFSGELATLTDPSKLHDTEIHAATAAAELADLGDAAGAAKAHTVHAGALAGLGRFAECEAALGAPSGRGAGSAPRSPRDGVVRRHRRACRRRCIRGPGALARSARRLAQDGYRRQRRARGRAPRARSPPHRGRLGSRVARLGE